VLVAGATGGVVDVGTPADIAHVVPLPHPTKSTRFVVVGQAVVGAVTVVLYNASLPAVADISGLPDDVSGEKLAPVPATGEVVLIR
jgi:hypothetical protein